MTRTPGPRKHLFTVDEYERLADTGIFHEDDRVELIEGEIVQMVPIGSEHAGAVNRLTSLFTRLLQERIVAGVQNPVRLPEMSEPQPDFVLLKPREDFYTKRHPEPADVLLLIEVAESSITYDRGVKLPLYAKAGIPEVWLVDLTKNRLEVYRSPSEDGYGTTSVLESGDTIHIEAFPDVGIAVADILG